MNMLLKARQHRKAIARTIACLLVLLVLWRTDELSHQWVTSLRAPWLDTLTNAVKPCGRAGFSLAVSAVLWLVGLALGNRRLKRAALLTVASITLSGAVVLVAKPLFGRHERLYVDNSSKAPAPSGALADRWGRFPSGDSAMAFSTAGAIAAEFAPAAPFCYTLAGLVGFERVYVRAHLASDVFAGAWLGLAVAHWLSRRRKSYDRHRGYDAAPDDAAPGDEAPPDGLERAPAPVPARPGRAGAAG